ncbi:MAG: BamA/TamA family outer membrane protein [bacterium]
MRIKYLLGYAIFVMQMLTFLAISSSNILAQDKEEEEIPKEQIPVEERETGDSFIENVGELPGRIVTLPLQLFFKGLSKVAGVIDYHEIVLRVTDWLTNEDGTRKVRPIFTPVSGGGLIFIQDNLFKHGMKFRALGSYGTRTRRHFYGGLRDPQLFAPKFGLHLAGFYQRKPDEDFFGIGNDSRKADQTNYLHEESRFAIDLISVPLSAVQFSAGFSYSNVNVKRGRDPNQPSLQDSASVFFDDPIPALFGAEMWSLLFKIYHDSRNATGHPTKGGEEYLSIEFSKELDGSEFGFLKYQIDLRRYIELFYKRVLALKVRTEITKNLAGQQIPFYRLAGLGGGDNLRGYRPVRFRDEDLMFVSAEYRFPIHSMVVATVFIEEGRVFSNIFDDFTFSDWKYSFGGGFRFRARSGNLTAIFDIAKSKEQIRFIFGLNTELRRF